MPELHDYGLITRWDHFTWIMIFSAWLVCLTIITQLQNNLLACRLSISTISLQIFYHDENYYANIRLRVAWIHQRLIINCYKGVTNFHFPRWSKKLGFHWLYVVFCGFFESSTSRKIFPEGTLFCWIVMGESCFQKNRSIHCTKISSKLKPGLILFYLQLKKLYEESQQKIKKLEVEVSVNKSSYVLIHFDQTNVTYFTLKFR